MTWVSGIDLSGGSRSMDSFRKDKIPSQLMSRFVNFCCTNAAGMGNGGVEASPHLPRSPPQPVGVRSQQSWGPLASSARGPALPPGAFSAGHSCLPLLPTPGRPQLPASKVNLRGRAAENMRTLASLPPVGGGSGTFSDLQNFVNLKCACKMCFTNRQ